MKHSLSTKGLSMSQAQSISNLCNQRVREITGNISDIRNTSKTIMIDGTKHSLQPQNSLPSNIIETLTKKAKLSATQAFLMENIKAKEVLINGIKNEEFKYEYAPIRQDLFPSNVIQFVNEDWGWNQLTLNEYNEFLKEEAYAAHIGQFFHKGGTLDKLRNELPNIQQLEFMEIEQGKKSPVVVTLHHTSEELLELHEDLSRLHRVCEQKVNYFKSKVKNLVTQENARISNENAKNQAEANDKNQIINDEYSKAYQLWSANYRKASFEFEAERQKNISEAVNLRIEVSPLFKDTVDELMEGITE